MKFAAFSGVLIEHSIQEAMKLTKQLGLDGIEIAVREPHLSPTTSKARVKEMASLSEDLGLDIPVLASYIGGFSTDSDKGCEQSFQDLQRLLDIAAELKSTMIRVSPGGPNGFMSQAYHYEKAAYWMERCAQAAKGYDIDIVMEIHNGSIVETVEESLRLLSLIPSDNIGMIHDAGNMYITDTDYGRDSVIGLGSRMLHVHVKDELRVNEVGAPGTFLNVTKHGEEKFLQSRMGEGGADHGPLFAAMKETGYNGWVTLECHAPFPAYERLEYDLQFVKKLIASV
ncbi:sugar phosphate isomerase/epimerase family protein [Paenibacillus chungangensis]|uniref:Sugar phosphate isomerase/epimerase family protein n=1 Tax=Paenibacillus chungangensis TaxID=696535 RepID=A0ABW3HX28_9BACL